MRTVISEATLEADFGGRGPREVEGAPRHGTRRCRGTGTPGGEGSLQGTCTLAPMATISPALVDPGAPGSLLPTPPASSHRRPSSQLSVRFPHEHAGQQICSQPRASTLPSPFITGFREMHYSSHRDGVQAGRGRTAALPVLRRDLNTKTAPDPQVQGPLLQTWRRMLSEGQPGTGRSWPRKQLGSAGSP